MKKAQPIRSLFLFRKLRRNNSGSILILVVWTIAFLSCLAVIFGARSIFSINLVSRFQNELKSHYLARSAASYVAGMIAKDINNSFDGTNEIWFDNENKFRAQSFGEGEFTVLNEVRDRVSGAVTTRYGLVDEDRKINLNTTTAPVLQRLFEGVAGVDEGQAKSFADAILDWRDEDSDRRPFGAEKYDYLGGEESYACADAPFQSVEELYLIKEMTPEIYDQIVPYVTVFGSGEVNVNTASSVVLSVLGLSDYAASFFYAYRAGGDGIEGTADDSVFNSVSAAISGVSASIAPEDVRQFTELNSAKQLGVKSDAFSFTIQSTTGNTQGALLVDCVLDRKGNILSWFER